MLVARIRAATTAWVRGPWVRGALVIVAVVAAANLWKLAVGLDSDPILFRAGLSVSHDPGILPGDHTIDPNDGITLQALARASVDQWLDGDVPYWNHFEGVGAPLAGEMQSMALYPFVFVHRLPQGFLLGQIIMESIAGIATLYFLRRLGIRRAIAVGAGIAYAFNGTFAWLSNAAASPVAYLPLLLLGIEIARDATHEKRRGGWAMIAIAIAGSLYAGFPETAYINGLFACLWCVVRFEGMARPLIKAFVVKLVAGVTAGLLLAMPIVVAFLDYLPRANVGGHTGALATATLPRTSVSALFMPYVYGPISAFNGSTTSPNIGGFWSSIGGYLTTAQLMLALMTIGVRRLRGMQLMVAVWFVVYLAKTYTFGPFKVIITIVNVIPGMNEMAYFRYSPPSLTMGMLILAAFGAQRLLDEQISRRQVAIALAGVAAVLLALALYGRTETQHFVLAAHYRLYFVGSFAFALGAVAVVGAVAWIRHGRHRAPALAVLLAAEAALLFMLPQLSTDKMTPVDTAPVEFLRDNLGMQRFYTIGPIAPNYGSDFGIASLNQVNLPVPKSWSHYILVNLDANTDPLNFNGTFRVNPAGPSALDEFLRNLQNFAATGTKYLVALSDPATSARVTEAGLRSVFDDGRTAIFELPAPGEYFQSVDGGCTVRPVSWQVADVECDQPGTIVRLELDDPGWSARVDGDRASIATHGQVFQSVSVPAGASRVTFRFEPRLIWLAWLASLIGVIWLVVLRVIGRAARTSQSVASSNPSN